MDELERIVHYYSSINFIISALAHELKLCYDYGCLSETAMNNFRKEPSATSLVHDRFSCLAIDQAI